MMIRNLPVTDLHRHLDGNVRISTILELGQQFGIKLPADNIEQLRPYVQVLTNQPDLLGFLAKLDWGVTVMADLDAVRRIAYENVEDALRANIDYTELRFSPYYMAMNNKLPLQGVVEAVIDGVAAGSRDFGLKTNLIGIMSRTFGADACMQELDALLACKNKLVAIDLAGDEFNQPGELFAEHFAKVRKTDLNITVHAGEAAGAASIWQAIDELGATRIGHGVNAVQDPALLEYLAKHRIGIESCITSNVQTNTVASFAAHPIKRFLQHGILVSLNSDDPAVSGIELPHEYQVAAPAAGLTQDEITQLQKNGLEMAFLSHSEKAQLLKKAQNRQ